jgi:hypothetical protein
VTGAALQTLKGRASVVASVLFALDGKLMVSGLDDKVVFPNILTDWSEQLYSLFLSNN